jgi:hypothetical protein
MFGVLDLSRDILLLIFDTWIDTCPSIVRLDTAIGNIPIRYFIWLPLLQEFTPNDDDLIVASKKNVLKSYYQWCIARKVRLTHLNLESETIQALFNMKFLFFPNVEEISTVTHIDYGNYEKLLFIAQRCPKLNSFEEECTTVNNPNSTINIQQLLIAITKISKIHLKKIQLLSYYTYSVIFSIAYNLSYPLVELDLHADCFNEAMLDVMISSPIFHKLQNLTICNNTESMPADKLKTLFHKINVHLQSLTVQGVILNSVEPYSSIFQMLSKCPSLADVNIDIFLDEDISIIDLLVTFPNLTNMIICDDPLLSMSIQYQERTVQFEIAFPTDVISGKILDAILLTTPLQSATYLEFGQKLPIDKYKMKIVSERFSTSLTSLSLCLFVGINVTDLSDLFSCCNQLTSLELFEGEYLGLPYETIIETIIKHEKKLKTIHFHCLEIPDNDIHILFEQLGHQLETICILDNEMLTDKIFDYFFQSSTLKNISLYNVSSIEISHIVTFMMQLIGANRHLNIRLPLNLKSEVMGLLGNLEEHKKTLAKRMVESSCQC